MEKQKYTAPEIVCVTLDNEISLQLASNPPGGPGEGACLTPEYLQPNPFKTYVG